MRKDAGAVTTSKPDSTPKSPLAHPSITLFSYPKQQTFPSLYSTYNATPTFYFCASFSHYSYSSTQASINGALYPSVNTHQPPRSHNRPRWLAYASNRVLAFSKQQLLQKPRINITLCSSLTPINPPTLPIIAVCLVNSLRIYLHTHNIPPFNLPTSRFCPLFAGSSSSSTYSPNQVELSILLVAELSMLLVAEFSLQLKYLRG